MNELIVRECLTRMLSEGLGLDLTDPNLSETPDRIARTYCQEFFAGLNPKNIPNITCFPNDQHYNEIIMLDNIPFVSMCSHHFLPFQGLAWFLYIPDELLIGASKVSRIISHLAARPQLQEKLTQQVVDFFKAAVNPLGAMLVMRAVHGCMSCRGIKQGLEGGMVTSVVYGSFAENLTTRNEGLELIKLSRR
jgi:GTP cyclohydrolase I